MGRHRSAPLSAAVRTAFETRRVDSFDDASIEFVVSTPPVEVRPALFVHGWGCNRGFWRRQLEAFGGERPSLALDLAGHGASAAGSRRYAIEEFALDALAAADAAAWASFCVVGHSMGGAVAVEVARAAPDRVEAVVSVDALTYPTVYPRVPEERIAAVLKAYRDDFSGAIRATMEPVFAPETRADLREEILAALDATPREPGLRAIEGLLRWDAAAAIAACTRPIHCLNAEAFLDRGAVPYAERLSIETLSGVGHFLMLEAPARFNRALAALLRRLD